MTISSGAPPTFSLRLFPDLSALAYVRLILRRTLPQLDETTDALFYGAVTEIVSNAVNAHVASETNEPVNVLVWAQGTPVIQVNDCGPGFDPDNTQPGTGTGFGLQIARSVCRGLAIESSEAGTSVTLPYPETP